MYECERGVCVCVREWVRANGSDYVCTCANAWGPMNVCACVRACVCVCVCVFWPKWSATLSLCHTFITPRMPFCSFQTDGRNVLTNSLVSNVNIWNILYIYIYIYSTMKLAKWISHFTLLQCNSTGTIWAWRNIVCFGCCMGSAHRQVPIFQRSKRTERKRERKLIPFSFALWLTLHWLLSFQNSQTRRT
jgi:hypothetical protein